MLSRGVAEHCKPRPEYASLFCVCGPFSSPCLVSAVACAASLSFYAAFKESLIPRAVEWFTGEISPPMFDDEFEEGFDDDDDFEEPPRRR